MNRRTRRTSGQTDVSVHSGSDSDGTESDSELSKTKSISKLEDGIKRKLLSKSALVCTT